MQHAAPDDYSDATYWRRAHGGGRVPWYGYFGVGAVGAYLLETGLAVVGAF